MLNKDSHRRQHYGFWLLLDEASRAVVQPTIDDLSLRYGSGEGFVPHVSVFSSQFINLETARKAIEQAAAESHPFEVEIETINFRKNDWSKTLFYQIKPNEQLTQISQNLQTFFKQDYDLYPHLSLVYTDNLSVATQQHLTKTVAFPKRLTLSALAVVNPHNPDNN